MSVDIHFSMKKDTIKRVRAVARERLPLPPNKKHKDKTKYTRKKKHKDRPEMADFLFSN